MRILLSNDDGILAPGIAALYSAVKDLGDVDVVAPDSPQSAAGHAITLSHPLTIQRIRVDGPDGFAGISVDGRPADCVRLAIRSLVAKRPELVLSGINAGSNVGINVFYSGTVAAAAEAAMFGLPAIAFSANIKGGEVDFHRIAVLCRIVLDRLIEHGLSAGELISVNIPPLEGGKAKGIRVVRQSTAGLEDVYHRQEVNGQETFRIGADYGFGPTEADTDVIKMAEGYITVTPLQIDRTAHDKLESLTRCRWTDADFR